MRRLDALSKDHDREGFDCGSEPLNRYLRQTARQHSERGNARTFVLVDSDASERVPILGYFSLTLCQGQRQWGQTCPFDNLSSRAATKACISGVFGARFQNLWTPCHAAPPSVPGHQDKRMKLESEALGQFRQQPKEPAPIKVVAEQGITPIRTAHDVMPRPGPIDPLCPHCPSPYWLRAGNVGVRSHRPNGPEDHSPGLREFDDRCPG